MLLIHESKYYCNSMCCDETLALDTTGFLLLHYYTHGDKNELQF